MGNGHVWGFGVLRGVEAGLGGRVGRHYSGVSAARCDQSHVLRMPDRPTAQAPKSGLLWRKCQTLPDVVRTKTGGKTTFGAPCHQLGFNLLGAGTPVGLN